jgi:hypothetical protein
MSRIFRYRNYRFFFFSREEPRMHIHIFSPDGEAKFWIEPSLKLAVNKGLRETELKEQENQIREHEQQIRNAWNERFNR